MTDELAAAAINGAAARKSAQTLDAAIRRDAHARDICSKTAERRNLEMRDLQGLGRMAATIPDSCYKLLQRLHPELDPKRNPKQADRNRYWLKWLQSDEAKPFLNTEKV